MLKRAENIFPFSFPRDHGQHPQFRTEWWYLNGRLGSEAGNAWAYHFTIFRRAFAKWSHLALIAAAMGSKSIREIGMFRKAFARVLENQGSDRIRVDGYVGHLSITNISEREFIFFERGSTSMLDIAGAERNGLCVWLKSWRLHQDGGPIRLIAERDGFGVDLEMITLKAPVLNGRHGLSRKGSEPGEASYHYSLTSLKTSGKIRWNGNLFNVAGSSFMDREFGTSILPRSVRGWDWFGIVLNNDHEVMISIIRDCDGLMKETSSATLVYPDGVWRCFESADLDVQVEATWVSATTGARYPVCWKIAIMKIDLELRITSLLKEHELVSTTSTTINYWEGPVDVLSRMEEKEFAGHGHVEMVGYAESAGGKF